MHGVACSKDDKDSGAGPRHSTTTERPATTTTVNPEDAAKQAVIEADLAATQARRDSAAPPAPNPDLQSLADTHAGLMFDQWRNTTTVLRANGFAIRYPEDSQARTDVDSVQIEDVDGVPTAYLETCAIDDGERIVVSNGEILQGGVRTIQATEAMQKLDGVWKLVERRENNYWEGVAGCAVD
jgi:hypothetical protein